LVPIPHREERKIPKPFKNRAKREQNLVQLAARPTFLEIVLEVQKARRDLYPPVGSTMAIRAVAAVKNRRELMRREYRGILHSGCRRRPGVVV